MTNPRMIETGGTMHLSANDFADWFADAAPGQIITYAIGDIGFSAPFGAELMLLKKLVWKKNEAGLLCLTQKRGEDLFARGGGKAFHYIATKRDIVVRKSA